MKLKIPNNVNVINYFLCRSLLLGGGLSQIFLNANTDTYIAVFLGTLLGIAITYIISKLNINLSSLTFNKLGNIIFKICYFIFLLFYIFIILIILSTFLYSYFLPFTPSFISCLPFIIIICFYSSKNITSISRIASILFIFSLLIIITKTLLLTNNFSFSNLLPILSNKPIGIFKGSLIYAVLSSSPFLLMLGEDIDFKESLKYYLIASIANLIVFLTITLVMGNMSSIYSYPEYAVLRKIKFFNFIENIENIISISWFFDLFVALSMASLKLKNICNTKHNTIPFIIMLLILFIVSKYLSSSFYNTMFIYKVFPWIILVLTIIIIILLLYKKRILKKHSNLNHDSYSSYENS